MASAFDVTRYVRAVFIFVIQLTYNSLYDSPVFSDVTIKFSHREVKCHKMVLFQSSDYFKAICGPESQFAEGNRRVIELQDDDPDAVEMMDRHFYNFPYDIYKQLPHGRTDAGFHMAVYMTAKKYLVGALQEAASNAVVESVDARRVDPAIHDSTATLFELVSILASNRCHNGGLGAFYNTLISENLEDLLGLPEFVAMLAEDRNKECLGFLVKAVSRGVIDAIQVCWLTDYRDSRFG